MLQDGQNSALHLKIKWYDPNINISVFKYIPCVLNICYLYTQSQSARQLDIWETRR